MSNIVSSLGQAEDQDASIMISCLCVCAMSSDGLAYMTTHMMSSPVILVVMMSFCFGGPKVLIFDVGNVVGVVYITTHMISSPVILYCGKE